MAYLNDFGSNGDKFPESAVVLTFSAQAWDGSMDQFGLLEVLSENWFQLFSLWSHHSSAFMLS